MQNPVVQPPTSLRSHYNNKLLTLTGIQYVPVRTYVLLSLRIATVTLVTRLPSWNVVFTHLYMSMYRVRATVHSIFITHRSMYQRGVIPFGRSPDQFRSIRFKVQLCKLLFDIATEILGFIIIFFSYLFI